MNGYDLRLDVPARALINAHLMMLLEQGGTFWDAKKHLFTEGAYAGRGLDVYGYRFCDHSLGIALLFCTIVVPRELLDLPQNHPIYQEFDAKRVPDIFTLLRPPKIDSYGFLRCLRNSVAHALFSITQSEGEARYEFWTERDPIFRATVGHGQLIEFINAVGLPLTNAVLEGKPNADA